MARNRNHEENGAAWDIVARVKYEAEIEEHIEFLRAGGTLLAPEIDTLRPFGHVVLFRVSHGLDALGLSSLSAGSVAPSTSAPPRLDRRSESVSAWAICDRVCGCEVPAFRREARTLSRQGARCRG